MIIRITCGYKCKYRYTYRDICLHVGITEENKRGGSIKEDDEIFGFKASGMYISGLTSLKLIALATIYSLIIELW